jgi:peptidyl-prolyl cis-trans isomerase D
MLAAFRSLAKSWFAKILFAVLILLFLVSGNSLKSSLVGSFSHAPIQAGSREVSAQEFRGMFDQQKKQIEQQQGRPITPEELAKAKLPERMADAVAGQQAFAAWTEQVGLRPSDKLVLDQLKQMPFFFNQITGVFDKEKFRSELQQRGLTESSFTRDLSDQLSGEHFSNALFAGLRAPRVYGALQAGYAFESRDASGFLVTPKVTGIPARPDDAALKAFIAANATRFRIPELRRASLVVFTQRQVAAMVTIDQNELRKRYEFKKESLSQAEKRSFLQFPAANQQTAARIAQALQAGQDPNAVAKTFNVKPVIFDARPRTAVPDPRVAAAAFALKPGETSPPIQGQLGWAVVKVTDVSAGKEVTFEEARPQLEAEMRQEAGTEKIYDLVQKYEDSAKGGVLMDANAKALGLQVIGLPPLNKDGVAPDGQRLGAPPEMLKRLMETAYSLPKNGESEVQEMGSGEYFVMRLDEVTPSALVVVDDKTRPMLTQMWMNEQVSKSIQAKAEELSGRLRKGESLQAVAASVGAPIETSKGLQRNVQDQALQPLVGQVFSHKVNEGFVAPTQHGVFVGKVDAIHPPSTIIAAGLSERVLPQVSMQMVRAMQEQAQVAARAKVKAKIDKAAINAAAGIAEQPTAPAKSPKT